MPSMHLKLVLRMILILDTHKLVPGQAISIHNDYTNNPDFETHKIIVQLNHSRIVKDGGIFCTFNSDSIRDVDRLIKPVHNSCFSFEISKSSYHAVSPVIHGERFTLIFSMYKN